MPATDKIIWCFLCSLFEILFISGKEIFTNDHAFDLRCKSGWRCAYFHTVIDCFLPAVPILHKIAQKSNHTKSTIIMPSYLYPIVFPIFKPDNHSIKNVSDCPGQSVANGDLEGISLTMPVPKMSIIQKRSALTLLYKYLPEPHQRNVILIQRIRKNRHLLNFQQLYDSIVPSVKAFNLSVTPFFGNESFAETLKLFRSSAIVIAVHGAGLANCIFSPNKTLVVEITTKSNTAKTWRSNDVVASVHGNLVWKQLLVDWNDLTPSLSKNLTLQWHIIDRMLKGRNYTLSRTAILEVTDFIERHLQTNQRD